MPLTANKPAKNQGKKATFKIFDFLKFLAQQPFSSRLKGFCSYS